MHYKKYIQQFSAAILLLIFIFATTPKRFLHAAFANHNDVAWSKVKNSNQTSINHSSYQCNIDNLVVELPFFNSTIFHLPFHLQHSSQFKNEFVFEQYYSELYIDLLRGPPVHC